MISFEKMSIKVGWDCVVRPRRTQFNITMSVNIGLDRDFAAIDWGVLYIPQLTRNDLYR